VGDPQNFSLLGAAINEVAHKDHFPFWMTENSLDLCIAELV